jgi:uncharacterized membrane protein
MRDQHFVNVDHILIKKNDFLSMYDIFFQIIVKMKEKITKCFLLGLSLSFTICAFFVYLSVRIILDSMHTDSTHSLYLIFGCIGFFLFFNYSIRAIMLLFHAIINNRIDL